ncbi:MAG: lytic transglycosylase domain-containing protein [Patescibacteria group bacterium]
MAASYPMQPGTQPQTSRRTLLNWLIVALVVLGAFLAVAFLPRIFAELSYPLAYDDVIRSEAEAHELDSFLVAAVIHTESRFRPTATSPVGARGLMQIMPLTGQGIARRLGDSDFTVDKLYDPATNIKYGAYHLQGLMGRYNSNVEAALVGYNGGGGAGDRFIRGETGSVPTESIRYYKKVLSAREKYRELYSVRLSDTSNVNTVFATSSEETLTSRLLRAVQTTVVQRISQ